MPILDIKGSDNYIFLFSINLPFFFGFNQGLFQPNRMEFGLVKDCFVEV